MAAFLVRATAPRERLCVAMALAGLGAATCLAKHLNTRCPAKQKLTNTQELQSEPQPERELQRERGPVERKPHPPPSRQLRKIRPLMIDLLADSDAQIRRKCQAALEGTLTPMLALRNHGCESLCAELAIRAREYHDTASLTEAQQACDLSGPLASLASVARTELMGITQRLLKILGGDDVKAGLHLQGRLCLRAYPAQQEETVRLGAHCDATLLTLLWSNAPGLQVMDPTTVPDWMPADVMGYGLPSFAGAPKLLQENQWAEVDLPWADGCLLMTAGTAWMSHAERARLPEAQSAVLHRVVAHSGAERVSLPFLVDASRVEESAPGVASLAYKR